MPLDHDWRGDDELPAVAAQDFGTLAMARPVGVSGLDPNVRIDQQHEPSDVLGPSRDLAGSQITAHLLNRCRGRVAR